ncbi:Hpt domain-containing protein [Novipirellula sp. SH528]|uniref:Hpt domain-containing protein n=1 Tax=Novipirellula sp. SH528 TaxID=3454466 RepID=UPI003FA01327
MLVVGDNFVGAQSLCDQLSQWLLSFTRCENAITCLRELRRINQTQSTYDVILMDASVAEQDGVGLVQQIEQDPAITAVPVILLSAPDHDPDLPATASRFIRHCIETPVSLTELRVAIESVFAESAADHDSPQNAAATPGLQPLSVDPTFRQRDDMQNEDGAVKRDVGSQQEMEGEVKPDKMSPDTMFFDRDALLQNTGGDLAFVNKLIEMFQFESRRQLATLRDAIGTRDGDTIKAAAHVLKGSVSLFGAHACVAEALKLEEMGEKDDLSDVEKQFQYVTELTEALCKELENFAKQ